MYELSILHISGFPVPGKTGNAIGVIAERNTMPVVTFISYEDHEKGVYKYQRVNNDEDPTREFQEFICHRNLNLGIPVKIVKAETEMEEDFTSVSTTYEGRRQQMIAMIESHGTAVIMADRPGIKYTLPEFIRWIADQDIDIKNVYSMTFYTKGLRETLEFIPVGWGCPDDETYLIVKEH